MNPALVSHVAKPATRAAITARCVRGRAAVLAVGHAWDDLFARAADAPPFLSRGWLQPFVESAREGDEPAAVAAWTGDRLVALLVVNVRRIVGVRVAVAPDAEHPGFQGLLLDRAHDAAAAKIAESCLAADLFDALRLDAVDQADFSTSLLLRELSVRGFAVRRVRRNPCLSIALGCTHAQFLEARKSKKSRKNLRQEERRVLDSADVRLEHLVGSEITPEAIRRAAAVQADSWMRRRGAAVLCEPLHERVAVSAAHSAQGHLWLLSLDGEDAAFGYALAAHGRMHFVWTAFRLRHEPLSIGKMLVHRIIADACGLGMRSFDFGHGDAEYKRFWSTDERFVDRVIAARNLRGRAAMSGFRVAWRLARIESLRSLRRALRRPRPPS